MSAPADHSGLSSDALPRLVGREREQALLNERLAAALGGQGCLTLIGGEAGIGKTTLAEELCRRATGSGAPVLVGRCYDLAETPPYGPWLELLEGVPALQELLPRLRDAAPGAAGSGGQAALFRQVREALTELAASQPLVVLLDDLHWADPASLDLLRYLAQGVQTLPLLLLATYRSDELHATHPLSRQLPPLVRESRATRVDLQRLRPDSVRDLVAERYGLDEPDIARLTAYLDARAEGNPLYVGELLRALEEAEALRETDAGWAIGDLSRVRVPALLRQIVTGRLFRLGKEARELLRVAAVIGQEVPYALWMPAGDATADAIDEVTELTGALGVLEARSDGAGARFRHALVREAVYDGIPALRRRQLHQQVGDALLRQANPDPDAVAFHFRQAGDPRAVEWLLRAGERAQRAYAWLSAADRYEAALALMDANGVTGDERAWLLVRLALMRRYADPEKSVAYLDEAASKLRGHEASALAAAIAYYRSGIRCLTGDLRSGLAEMKASVAALDALPVDELTRLRQWQEEVGDDNISRARGLCATWLSIAGHFAEARAEADSVIAALSTQSAPVAQDRLRSADAYAALGRSHAVQGRPEEAQIAMESAAERYRSAGNHALLYTVTADRLNLVVLPYATTDLAGRERLTQEAEYAYRQASNAITEGTHCPVRHRLLFLEGRWTELVKSRFSQHASADVHLPHARNVVALLAHSRGQTVQAWKRVREVLPLGPSTPFGGIEFLTALELQRLAAALAQAAGDLHASREWLEAHDQWIDWAKSILGRAEGCLSWATHFRAAGEPGMAYQRATQGLREAMRPRQPLALLGAHRLLGELDTDAGRYADATRHLEASLALADACAARYERALTLLALAELRGATGGRDSAVALLDQVRAICVPLDAHLAIARADALSKRLAATKNGSVRRPAGLTAREVDVLRLVAQGLTDAQVAGRLFLSPRTVSTHLTSIYTKLGISSRAAATRFAIEQGLI